ncbi:MAG: BlaI/MecI/CopY family transcriptional regulator [Acidobacteriota bacterium]
MPKKGRAQAITPAEFAVLESLCELGVGTVAAVHAALPAQRRVSYNTVLTQVRFLHAKGFLEREALGRAHLYRPKVSLDQARRKALTEFLGDYFGGDRDAMLALLREPSGS